MALRAREGSSSLVGRKVLAMINRARVHVFDGAYFASNNCVSLPTSANLISSYFSLSPPRCFKLTFPPNFSLLKLNIMIRGNSELYIYIYNYYSSVKFSKKSKVFLPIYFDRSNESKRNFRIGGQKFKIKAFRLEEEEEEESKLYGQVDAASSTLAFVNRS